MADETNDKVGGVPDAKKVVIKSSADSTVKPSSVTQFAPAINAANSAAPVAAIHDGRSTIKLKPLQPAEVQSEEETVSMDRDSLDSGLVEAVKDADRDAETVKIQKPIAKTGAAVKPAMPGAKQTIKLRPSAGTVVPSEEDGLEPVEAKAGASTIKVKPVAAVEPVAEPSQAKKTIRLVPKKQEEAKPAADAKANEEPTAAFARPSALTTKLPAEAEEDVEATISDAAASPSSSKKTLKLRTTKLPKPAATAEVGEGVAPVADMSDTDAGLEVAKPSRSGGANAGADEGQLIFAIAAIVALLLTAYFMWMTLGQFGEQYLEWTTANVPGLSGGVR